MLLVKVMGCGKIRKSNFAYVKCCYAPILPPTYHLASLFFSFLSFSLVAVSAARGLHGFHPTNPMPSALEAELPSGQDWRKTPLSIYLHIHNICNNMSVPEKYILDDGLTDGTSTSDKVCTTVHYPLFTHPYGSKTVYVPLLATCHA